LVPVPEASVAENHAPRSSSTEPNDDDPSITLSGAGLNGMSTAERIRYHQEQLLALRLHEEDRSNPTISSTPKTKANTRRRKASERYKEAISIEMESSDERGGKAKRIRKAAGKVRAKQAREELDEMISD
jgi:hypothetical protein